MPKSPAKPRAKLPKKKASERAAAFLASIVESSQDSIIGTDLNGDIVSWNRGAQAMFGYTAREVAGKSITLLFPDTQKPEHRTSLDKIQRHERIQHFESQRVAKDGTVLDLAIILSPVRDADDNLLGASAIYRDITDRKRTEAELISAKQAAESANRAKSEFLANMSHEIRTPMNVVMGMTDLLLDTPLNDEQDDYAQTIRRGAEGLLAVINDILDFSKIEAGKIDVDNTDFPLEEVFGEVASLMSSQAGRKGLELNAEIEGDLPTLIHGDPVRLRQVLVNLTGNAVKFTEKGEVEISTRRASLGGREFLRFEVRDTGIGMPPEVQARVFDAFAQADGSTTRKYGGTGLGLTISKTLVELMGGSIGLDSKAGSGSTFWFTLPLIPALNQHKQPPLPVDLARLKVLAVDDNQTNRRIVHQQLRSLNIECALAVDAMDAIVKLRDAVAVGKPFDLVILDYGMPGMNGIDLARIVRSDQALRATRLVLMTSYAEKKCRENAVEAGIEVILNKPVRKPELVQALTRATGNVASLPTQSEQTRRPRHGSRERLLLVEDNADNRKLALRLLDKYGYQCDVANNGAEALQLLGVKHYPLVLMDCQMPLMDGYQTTAAIRQSEGNAQHTPIIAMTAHAVEGDREKCLAAGMDDYISKPLAVRDLIEMIERWLPAGGAAASPPPEIRIQVPRELEDLIPNYLANRKADVSAIARALEDRNLDAIRVIGHGMRGSGAGYGFARITEIGANLEHSAKATDVGSIQSLLQALEDYVLRVTIEFN